MCLELNNNNLIFQFFNMKVAALIPFKLSEYQILHTLGTGSFGRVKLARNKATGKYFALKTLRKQDIIRTKQVDHVINETSILQEIKHPFIVSMEGFAQDSRHLYFLLEFIAGGELFSYLRTIGNLQPSHAAFYAAQIVLCFQYLHSKNIVYRDLKPENILINGNGYLKLTDFGFAKEVMNRTFTLCGTPQYLAPEIILNVGHGKPVDWWALGILIYEMITGIDPFSADDPMNIYQNILKCKPKFGKDFDKSAKSLIKHLLIPDLSSRYGNLKDGIKDIKEHRMFSNINWKHLMEMTCLAPFKPTVKKPGDTSNFMLYPDSVSISTPIPAADDPFLQW